MASTIKYLYSGAAGSGTGNDWTNAYTSLSAAKSGTPRDGLCYVADGTYTAYDQTGESTGTGTKFDTALNGTQTIEFRKATASDHGTETGWLSAMGDGFAQFNGQLNIETGYYIFDGIVGGGPSNNKTDWTTGHGFIFSYADSYPIIRPHHPSGTFVLRHFKTIGAGNNGTQAEWGNDSVNSGCGASASVTLEYGYLTQAGRCHYYHSGGPMTSSWVYTAQHESTEGEHSEVAVIRSSDLFVFRWGIVTHMEGTGGFISANDSDGRDGPNGISTVELYGNIFYDSGEFGAWDTGNNGFIASFTLDAFQRNWKVYNNTFIDIAGDCFGESGESPSGNVAKNNIFYLSSSRGLDTGWTMTHCHFVDSGSTTGTNGTTASGDPFEDFTNYDFRLLSDTTDGDTSLASPYNVDMYGTTRTGTRGAIDFASNSLGGGSISGSSTLTFSASGTLRGAGALSGSSSLSFTASGALNGTARVTAAITGNSTFRGNAIIR